MIFDTFYYNEENFLAIRHETVLGCKLVLAVHKDGFVFFTVDDCWCISDSISTPTGAVLLRWVFKTWADILSSELKLLKTKCFCSVLSGDGIGSRRRRAISKAGFISSRGSRGDMEYHDNSQSEEVA